MIAFKKTGMGGSNFAGNTKPALGEPQGGQR